MDKLTNEQVLDEVLTGVTLAAMWSSYRSVEQFRTSEEPVLWHTRREFVAGLEKLPFKDNMGVVLTELLHYHPLEAHEQLLPDSDYSEDN